MLPPLFLMVLRKSVSKSSPRRDLKTGGTKRGDHNLDEDKVQIALDSSFLLAHHVAPSLSFVAYQVFSFPSSTLESSPSRATFVDNERSTRGVASDLEQEGMADRFGVFPRWICGLVDGLYARVGLVRLWCKWTSSFLERGGNKVCKVACSSRGSSRPPVYGQVSAFHAPRTND